MAWSGRMMAVLSAGTCSNKPSSVDAAGEASFVIAPILLKDDVRRQSLRVELLHHSRDLRVVGILGLKFHLHVTRQRRRNGLIFERRLVHDETVLAPRRPHIDEDWFVFPL